MLKALIFDFNGVILDDEPIHYLAMRDAVARVGIALTRDEYWSRYLPMDDGSCLEAICRDRKISLSQQDRADVLARKAENYFAALHSPYPLFPGVLRFVLDAAARYPLALASGARRQEIENALRDTGLESCFTVIAGAEDFTLGKPHPECFLTALDFLNRRLDGKHPFEPRECIVLEDSVAGVRGAKKAGMSCVAVANTYQPEELLEADLVVESLAGLPLDRLATLVEDPS